jgi:putative ATP-dependent endonuclease of the OLD family
MQLDRLRVRNFRNLADLDVPLSPGTVVVGENRAGKSNLVHALRLVLDASLPNSDRQLRAEDFWDGLSDGSAGWDPMAEGAVIDVTVEMSAFDDDPVLLAVLGDALISEDPVRARLTFRFAPRPTPSGEDPGSAGYEWRIFGGEDEDLHIAGDLRGYLHFVYLHALRDVAGDIVSWRRSPLRGLLEAAAADASPEELQAVAAAISAANAEITQLVPIEQLGRRITERTREMVGGNQALEAELGVAALDPIRLLRELRLFVDGTKRRSIASASLGSLNVLYLALLELGLEQRLKGTEIAHVVMAIEEPEAHLHPHLQRLIFRRLLRPEERETEQTTLVTTHSPHIVSVAPPRNLVVLRSVGDRTEAAVAAVAALESEEWNDIERYLDATRAELVFARGVLLVEGYAEQVLVPALAEALGLDLDQHGISVCAIHGTHFGSYVRFLSALEIPWAVITDGDPTAKGVQAGVGRATRLLERLGSDAAAEEEGIFVGDTTFEYDVLTASDENADAVFDALESLGLSAPRAATVASWRDEAGPPAAEDFLPLVNAAGKGRLAHRLAVARLDSPEYVAHALRYLWGEDDGTGASP